MKAFSLMMALACLFVGPSVHAQYKAPSQYFPKNSPAPAPGGQPAAPKAPDKQTPAIPQLPKFKDLSVNASFYFISDTNRTYAWTKISATSAKNTKNGVTQAINGETPVQK